MTHYEVLGVSSRATDAEIRAQFHSIAKGSHPDTNCNDPLRSEAYWLAAQQAYNAIKTPELRQAYDAKLAIFTGYCKVCKGLGETQQRRGWKVFTSVCMGCLGTGRAAP